MTKEEIVRLPKVQARKRHWNKELFFDDMHPIEILTEYIGEW